MIYFYWGADSYRSKQTVRALKGKFKEKYDPDGHNIETIDEQDFSLEKFFTAAKAMGFLSPKKCIVIKNIFSVKNVSDISPPIVDYLDTLGNTTEENYLVFWHEGTPRKNSKLFTYLTKRCDPRCQMEFGELSGERLRSWVIQYVNALGHSMPVALANLVIELIGHDPWRLANELKKICHAGGEVAITQELIENTVSEGSAGTIFPLLDAIGMRNRASAMELFEEALRNDYEYQFIIAMMGRHIRQLIETKRVTQQTNNAYAVAQSLNVLSFVAKKLMQQSQRFAIDELIGIHDAIVRLDLALKRTPERMGAMMTILLAKL